ncbi:MAG: 16S rRNA (adenine(1518)-N(6)/adenine(1519)-N(6))-dimethyltransferase RsmA [Bacteroidota bacterium]
MDKAKKYFGQHFLQDKAIAEKIVEILGPTAGYAAVVEIGAGRGALTGSLVAQVDVPLYLVEIDRSLAQVLQKKYSGEQVHVIMADFLAWSFADVPQGPIALIGNLPYNISSPIFFKVFHHHTQIKEVVCMVQHEVGARIAAKSGNKTYGILSVLLQAFYEVTYCFGVAPTAFTPPPRVQSAVIKLVRNNVAQLDCDLQCFVRVVKMAFQQRRKMLSNALRPLGVPLHHLPATLLQKRAEALNVAEFITLTKQLMT